MHYLHDGNVSVAITVPIPSFSSLVTYIHFSSNIYSITTPIHLHTIWLTNKIFETEKKKDVIVLHFFDIVLHRTFCFKAVINTKFIIGFVQNIYSDFP